MNKAYKYHKLYMDIAERTSLMSFAKRLKVGCVIVKDTNILSFSWNGTLPSRPNECELINEDGSMVTKDEVIHAEENAIVKASKYGVSLQGSTLYVTHLPCIKCSRMIIASGIKFIYYKYDYGNKDVIKLFNDCNVNIERLENVL